VCRFEKGLGSQPDPPHASLEVCFVGQHTLDRGDVKQLSAANKGAIQVESDEGICFRAG
jgi:hypothetical protein